MKITFILPYASLNGGHRVVATYARTLTERGHEVTIVSQPFRSRVDLRTRVKILLGRRRKPVAPPDIGTLLVPGVRHHVLESARAPGPQDVPDADIVVATWWQTAEWVAALPASKGRKFHLLQDYEMFPNLPRDRVAAGFRLDLKKVAVSNYIRDEIRTHHGIDGIEVIPNAVDTAQFDAPPRERNAALTVGLLYTATPRKNVRLAIEALTRAKARLPHLKAVAFGSKHVQQNHLPLPDWVTYLENPDQARIPGIYAQCDLWLFTSDHEGFGLPVLEAMACRTPVLATRAGAAPELVTGDNGTLLDSDADAFVREIERFDAMDADDWRGFSDAAYGTARSYGWDDATDRLVHCFQATSP